MGTENWLNQFHDALTSIRMTAHELNRLSSAFGVTGNERMADELHLIAEELRAAHDQASAAVSKDLNERVNSSQRSFYETAGLVLGHILDDGKKAAKGAAT